MLSLVTGHSALVAVFLRFVDGMAFTSLVLLIWIPLFWFIFHPAIRTWRRIGRRAFWVALPVWSACAVSFILARHWLFARRLERDVLTWAAGGLLFVVAGWLEVKTRRALGWRRLVGLAEVNPTDRACGVVSGGIYARLRHPRYLLYILMLLSTALLSGAVAIFSLAILNVLMYQILARLEERALLDQYGHEYESYQRSVPRFVPRLGRSR